jgi:hypothetical protein
LEYRSGIAPDKHDVLGTLMLGPLAGHRRYAHITALRGDAVAAHALGYNPAKPGQPSHVLHTFWVGNLRLVLDVQVNSGKQHTSLHAKAALGRLLDVLGDKRPALVRGGSGYDNEGILLELERRNQPYLLRLRQTANVQGLVAQQFARTDWSRADNQGCQMAEDWLQLNGWSSQRRVVIVR